MKSLSFILCICLFVACGNIENSKPIVNVDDYQQIFDAKPKSINTAANIKFWSNKIKQTENSYTFQQKLAEVYLNDFEATGQIENLTKAQELLENSLKFSSIQLKPKVLLSLSANSINLHHFNKALEYAIEAAELSNENYGPLLMQFDALMEIGDYDKAELVLAKTKRMDDFDYLVRYAKYQDYIGQLDSAIYYMETAMSLSDYNQENTLWVKASLGDYYGHDGQIEKSYSTFVDVLKVDRSYTHAIEGIAWIAFSYDKNPSEAIRLLEHVQNIKYAPTINLDLAEIYRYMGDENKAFSLERDFLRETSRNELKALYSNYWINTLGGSEASLIMDMAHFEVSSRPTPSSYSNLALAHYYNGNFNKAVEILDNHVVGFTYEPAIIFKAAKIYKQVGKQNQANELFALCREASFELGPVVMQELKSLKA